MSGIKIQCYITINWRTYWLGVLRSLANVECFQRDDLLVVIINTRSRKESSRGREEITTAGLCGPQIIGNKLY